MKKVLVRESDDALNPSGKPLHSDEKYRVVARKAENLHQLQSYVLCYAAVSW